MKRVLVVLIVALTTAVLTSVAVPAAQAYPIPTPPTIGHSKWYCGTEVYSDGSRDRWCWKGRVLRATQARARSDNAALPPKLR